MLPQPSAGSSATATYCSKSVESDVRKQLCGTSTMKLGVPTLSQRVTKGNSLSGHTSDFSSTFFPPLLFPAFSSPSHFIPFHFLKNISLLPIQLLHTHFPTHLSHHDKHPTPPTPPPLHHPPLLPHRPPPRPQQRNRIRNIHPLTNLRLYYC